MKRLALLLCVAAALAGCSRPPADSRPVAAVTTSYLECAVQDLAGSSWRVARLLPPGCCPGHFDVSPAMLDTLSDSRILLRFEFQSSLDEKLRHFCRNGLKIVAVPSPEGLCLPATYAEVCRAVCTALCEAQPEHAAEYQVRVAEIEKRMDDLALEIKTSIADSPAAGARVVASAHQARFCGELGLDLAAAFTGQESAGLKELEQCIDAGKGARVRFIVANLQEGVQLAAPLADRLEAKIVVFSNFPAMTADETTFDALVRRNIAALLAAAGEASR